MTVDQYITIGTSAAGLVGMIVVAYLNSQRTDKKVQDLTVHINSRMEQFIELIKTSSFAEGAKSEVDKGHKPETPKPEDPKSWDFMPKMP